MNIKYATGDLHFKGDLKYLCLMFIGDSPLDVAIQRNGAHSSHSSIIYKIDYDKTARIALAYGCCSGIRTMCLVRADMGYYFDILETAGWVHSFDKGYTNPIPNCNSL